MKSLSGLKQSKGKQYVGYVGVCACVANVKAHIGVPCVLIKGLVKDKLRISQSHEDICRQESAHTHKQTHTEN